jgi:hypothetical protein
MKKIPKFLVYLSTYLIIFLMLTVPVLALAQTGGLVPCNNNSKAVTINGQTIQPTPCGFDQLLTLVNTVIKFILFDLSIPIAAIMFAYAGFLLVTSAGSTEKRGTAKKIFTNVAIGLIFIAAAWLIIRTILTILGFNGTWIGF